MTSSRHTQPEVHRRHGQATQERRCGWLNGPGVQELALGTRSKQGQEVKGHRQATEEHTHRMEEASESGLIRRAITQEPAPN